ncbi:hypothetical protein HYT17_03515 [Candidatus Microgenomates bacterium]|nr:hypothetical protein [Candidatus Microgenomates bacterium]
MKYLPTTIITVLLLLLFAFPIFAQDATSSTNRKDRVATREAKRQELIENKQVRQEEKKQRIASKTAELKARLAEFRDKKKTALVEKINNSLNTVNDRQTAAMQKHLEKMEELLTKLEERVNNKAAEGKDTSSASAALASSATSIALAKSAVEAQAGKDYTIQVSSESAVRTDAKAARDALHADLKQVRQLVVAAKQSLANAIAVAAKTLGGIGDGK